MSDHVAPLLPDQPPPVGGDGDVWADLIDVGTRLGWSPALLRAMTERRALGIERCGTPLCYDNGRDPEVDLIQELLGAMAYAWQCDRQGLMWTLAADVATILSERGAP